MELRYSVIAIMEMLLIKKIKDSLNSLESEDIFVLSGIKAVKGKDKFYPVEFGLKPLLYIVK